MPLTPTEAQRAADMYSAGNSYRVIAAELRRAWSDVRAAIHAAPVTVRPRGPVPRADVDDADIVHLRDVDRLSWRQIAAEVGMVPSGCRRRYARAHGAGAAERRRI